MRALVLSGGASRGAFQVGVLKALAGRGEVNYDLFCGTSVGALNAAFLAQHKDGALAVGELERIWRTLDTSKVWRPRWPWGVLSALWQKGVYSTKPLETLVRTIFHPEHVTAAGKALRVLAVNLQTYQTGVWGETDPEIMDAVLASSAFPIMFPARQIGGEWWTDGGVRQTTPLGTAIDAGATDIDVIITYQRDPHVYHAPPRNALDVAMAALEIMIDEVAQADLRIAQLHNEAVVHGIRQDKRKVAIRVFEPKGALPGSPLSFEPDEVSQMIALGYSVGIR